MTSRRLSRRAALVGVGTAALTVGTATLASATPGSSTAVPSPGGHTAKEELNKRVVLGFVDLGLNKKEPQEAADLYLGDLVQHNPNVADGKEGWVAWATGFVKAVPTLNVDFKRVLVDGEFVTLHTHITVSPTDRGTAAIDIFRVKNGKIVEHWDASIAIPATSANDNGIF